MHKCKEGDSPAYFRVQPIFHSALCFCTEPSSLFIVKARPPIYIEIYCESCHRKNHIIWLTRQSKFFLVGVKGIPAHINISMVINRAGGYGRCTLTDRDARNYLDQKEEIELRERRGCMLNGVLWLIDQKVCVKSAFEYYLYLWCRAMEYLLC